MQVGKWGNSLAVRLPASVVEGLELKEGDEIEIEIADARTVQGPTRYQPRGRLAAAEGSELDASTRLPLQPG
jgi:antitoxin MazE